MNDVRADILMMKYSKRDLAMLLIEQRKDAAEKDMTIERLSRALIRRSVSC